MFELAGDGRDFRQEWSDGKEGEFVIGFVGSLKPWHGTEMLLEAFATVAARDPRARLVLVGDGPSRGDIEAVVRLQIKGLQPGPDHTFEPNKAITRAEFAMMIEDILIKITGDNSLATKFIGTESPFPDLRSDLAASRSDWESRRAFAAEFLIARPLQAQRSTLQALALMNGEIVSELASPQTNRLALALAESPFLNVRQQVETLVAATLCRPPSADELQALSDYIQRRNGRTQALCDVFWALVNGSEFNSNR